ncbi:right-handed parallel beta-helix repeat-containing protein [Propionibacteriaceae bacterium Y2011]
MWQPSSGQHTGQDGLNLDHCRDVELTGFGVEEIQGLRGVAIEHSENVLIDQCRFFRCTYAMVFLYPDCARITVRRSEFDTLVSQAYPNTYTFATVRTTGNRWPHHVLIEDCRFLNNPLWEGVDSHGASDLVIRNNHIENCRVGIMVANAYQVGVGDSRVERIRIENNTVIQGAGNDHGYGIVVTGQNSRAEDVRITGNLVRGFGGATELNGTITVFRADDVLVADNTVEDYGINAIALYYGTNDVRIMGNTIGDVGRRKDGTVACAIAAAAEGHYGLQVEDNVVRPSSAEAAPEVFLRAGAYQSWQIGANDVSDLVDTMYHGVEYLPIMKQQRADMIDLHQKSGDVISGGSRTWHVRAPRRGYGAVAPEQIVLYLTLTAGSRHALVAENADCDWRGLPPDMNVVIADVGPGGADLHARVISNNGTIAAGDTAPGPPGPVAISLDRASVIDSARAAVRLARLELRGPA